MSFGNKRKIQRYELSIPGFLKFHSEQGKKAIEYMTKDISSKGAFFYSNRSMSRGSGLNVDLVLPNHVHINVEVIVIRSAQNGFAVLFDSNYYIISNS